MNVEDKLRELLLPVFGISSIEEIQPEHSLITDLGADSLDFVELVHVIEVNFKVALTPAELVTGGHKVKTDNLFIDGRLIADGVKVLRNSFAVKHEKIVEGMTKLDLLNLITVRDLAQIIESRMNRLNNV